MGTLSAPFSCLCQKLSLSPLYFNKTLLHKSSERSSLVSGPKLNSSSLEAKNPGVFGSFSKNFSKRSSQPRDQTCLSCIHRRILYHWVTWEALHFGIQFSLVPQSCPTLCDPMDCSLPGSSLHGILQARVLEWVAIFLLQGIFQTQGSNPGLPHCGQTL